MHFIIQLQDSGISTLGSAGRIEIIVWNDISFATTPIHYYTEHSAQFPPKGQLFHQTPAAQKPVCEVEKVMIE
ncbi:MAG: hypothetical protein IPM91_19730 [Bacteroidetes bacterium]|nr:hypothetical protein [Bacteroidota bacterium]